VKPSATSANTSCSRCESSGQRLARACKGVKECDIYRCGRFAADVEFHNRNAVAIGGQHHSDPTYDHLVVVDDGEGDRGTASRWSPPAKRVSRSCNRRSDRGWLRVIRKSHRVDVVDAPQHVAEKVALVPVCVGVDDDGVIGDP
jgi:hypothetical protein